MSDINGTVAALQGTPVSSTAPTAGELLVYDGYAWVPTVAPSLQTQTFNSNGSWTCPANIHF